VFPLAKFDPSQEVKGAAINLKVNRATLKENQNPIDKVFKPSSLSSKITIHPFNGF
jgi:hypothetical protein